MRMNKVYELTTNGVNAAIRDYIMNNWQQLSFRGIDKEKILEIESVELNIQTEFTQKGNYPFRGSARPQVSSDEGGHSTQNWSFSGDAQIGINSKGQIVVEGMKDTISFSKK